MYIMEELWFEGRPIIIKVHAIKQARRRGVSYPEQVRNVIKTGKVVRFGKKGIKFIKRSKNRSTICVGEYVGDVIAIKTIERGN